MTIQLNIIDSSNYLLTSFSCCLVAKSCLTLLQPHGLKPDRLLCHGKNIGVGCIFFSRGSSQPRDRTHDFCLAEGGFLTTEPPGKPNLKVMNDQRIEEIANHIINNHASKTRNQEYTAIFTVQSIPMLIKYYDAWKLNIFFQSR